MKGPNSRIQIPGVRWYIAGLLCSATALNYLDRQTLSILAGTIKAELHISTVEYSYITAAFLTSYTIMYVIGGRLVDRIGTKRALAVFAAGWSLVSGFHGTARTAVQFGLYRFLLGATEAANFPALVKASSEWFPVSERALGVGIANSGSAIGAAIAAPLVYYLALSFGWRSAFLASGVIGLIWVFGWILFYRAPARHPMVRPSELAWIEQDDLNDGLSPQQPGLKDLLRRKETWGCIGARALTDPITYFFVFWTPLFLQQERGFNLAAIGKYSWIPFVALAIGNIAGGLIPRQLAKVGWSINRSRKCVMAVASLLIATSVAFLVHSKDPAVAVGLICVALFCHGAWANMTLPAEVFPKNVVASVSGLGGATGALVSALTTPVIGWIVQDHSFTPVLITIAALPGIAWLIVCLTIKELGAIRPVRSNA